jgi:DNA-binding GntR family transcriptional regulator
VLLALRPSIVVLPYRPRTAAGEWQPDAMLPNERALAEKYSVALNTLRRAIGELTGRGLVTVLPHKGTCNRLPVRRHRR